jgi:hypothetical protein
VPRIYYIGSFSCPASRYLFFLLCHSRAPSSALSAPDTKLHNRMYHTYAGIHVDKNDPAGINVEAGMIK